MIPTYDFSGKVALVTGAAQGLGFATARAFAESKATVVLSDIDAESLEAAVEVLTAEGHTAVGLACDVRREDEVKAMIEAIATRFGSLDMAFNNAGIGGPEGPVTGESEAAFDAVNAVNLKGVWACMKHELIQMRRQGSGSIVNCSSMAGFIGLPGRGAYHGTKHALQGLTQCAALDVATQNIRVNAVCPGTFDTPLVAALDPAAIREFMRDQSIGRLGRPEELAQAVLWLCSDGASFVLGAALLVDGGFTAH